MLGDGAHHHRDSHVGKALTAAAGDLCGGAARTTCLKRGSPQVSGTAIPGVWAASCSSEQVLRGGCESCLLCGRGPADTSKRQSRAVAITWDGPGWSVCVGPRHAHLRATVRRRAMATQREGTRHVIARREPLSRAKINPKIAQVAV